MEMNVDELKEFIKDLMETRAVKTDMEFKLIRQELSMIASNTDVIKAETTKTNGRVTKLEIRVNELEKISDNHYFNCPNNKTLRDLQDENLSRKSVRKWLLAAIGLAGLITGLVLSLLKLFSL